MYEQYHDCSTILAYYITGLQCKHNRSMRAAMWIPQLLFTCNTGIQRAVEAAKSASLGAISRYERLCPC